MLRPHRCIRSQVTTVPSDPFPLWRCDECGNSFSALEGEAPWKCTGYGTTATQHDPVPMRLITVREEQPCELCDGTGGREWTLEGERRLVGSGAGMWTTVFRVEGPALHDGEVVSVREVVEASGEAQESAHGNDAVAGPDQLGPNAPASPRAPTEGENQ